MNFDPKPNPIIAPRSCRLVQSGTFADNRECYMAQSKLTKGGVRAELPSLTQARNINQGK
jgi:hypothetical protein